MATNKEIAEKLKNTSVTETSSEFNKESLYDLISKCEKCRLHSLDTNKQRLKPWGFVRSLFILVGQNPSSTVDEDNNEFFWKESSNRAIDTNFNLLKNTFSRVGLDFYTMWKTNAQKCRYSDNSEFDETCFSQCKEAILKKEIDFVDPKVIFLLGEKVAKSFGIEEKHKLVKKDDVFYCWIYHPSYCLRGGITKEKYEDQLSHIEKEISSIRDEVFVNFHHHNQFSLRDGLGDEKSIAKRLIELRYPGFSLTNHGNVNCHFRQYNVAKESGLKPVFGTEIYYNENREAIMSLIKEDSKEAIAQRKEIGSNTCHLTVVASNKTGYYNLISMNNEALMNSFYKVPLIDDKLIEKYKEGLIVFSGCAGAYIPRELFSEEKPEEGIKRAYDKAEKYLELFGDSFYIELMSSKFEHQKNLNEKLIKLSRDLKIKTVITNDCHYARKELSRAHDILLLAGTDSTLEDAQDPTKKVWQFNVKDLYIKSPEEIKRDDLDFLRTENYNEEIINESFDNVHKIFSKIETFDIDATTKYPKLGDKDSKEFFIELIKRGIEKRKKLIKIDDEFKERLKLECDTIIDFGFMDYMIVLQDILNWAKATFGEYSIGCGRGCFLPNTKIILDDGSKFIEKEIKDIEIGDKIAFLKKTTTVKNKFEYDIDEEIIELTFKDANNKKTKTIRCTKDHLFLTKRGWIEAINLDKIDDVVCVRKNDNHQKFDSRKKENLYKRKKPEWSRFFYLLTKEDFLSFEEALILCEENIKTKKKLKSVCMICKKEFTMQVLQMANRTYGKEKSICGKCYVPKYVTQQIEWKNKQAVVQSIAQNKPKTKRKNSMSVKRFWRNHPEVKQQVREKILVLLEDENYRNSIATSRYKGDMITKFGKLYFHSLLELNFILNATINPKINTLTRWNLGPITYKYYKNRNKKYYPDFIVNDNKVVEVKSEYYLETRAKIILSKKKAFNSFLGEKFSYEIISEKKIGTLRFKDCFHIEGINFWIREVREEYEDKRKKAIELQRQSL